MLVYQRVVVWLGLHRIHLSELTIFFMVKEKTRPHHVKHVKQPQNAHLRASSPNASQPLPAPQAGTNGTCPKR